MRDLWADFAEEALPTEGTNRGGGLRRRRLTEQAALMALRAWLLHEYMLPYGTSLGATRIFKRCYWIDGLGNTQMPVQGIFTDIEEAPLASKRRRQKPTAQDSTLPPALQLAAATARRLARLDRPILLYSFLLDEKRGRRKVSSEAGQPSQNGMQTSMAMTLPKEGGLLSGSWPELSSTLLAALEQSAAVFLLDPLKDGLFRYTDLAPLYQRTAPTELFLWLSHKEIGTRLLPRLRTGEMAAALTNLLRGDRWKGLLAKGNENAELAIHGLVELLAESMRPHFLTVQQLALPMCIGPARVETAPGSLIFATRRQDSLFSMNDAACLRERQLIVESQRGVLNEAWFAGQREEQAAARLEALTQEARELGRVQRIRRWPDLRQLLLLAHFGQYTLRDYEQVIGRLLERGEVRCEWCRHATESDEARLPSQDDLLLWK
ncbi:MAG TPA: hypothetical protein VKV19_08425 [Ktedonobacteraceae bacterium]|nr:hypothetical protein [Ktedonobacteraceae bacterium]